MPMVALAPLAVIRPLAQPCLSEAMAAVRGRAAFRRQRAFPAVVVAVLGPLAFLAAQLRRRVADPAP